MKRLLSTRVVKASCYLFRIKSFLFFRKINESFDFCFFLYPGFLLNMSARAFFVFFYIFYS
jgi:hypothetical protein